MVGGGIAGLWTLRRLLRAGLDAVLLESSALGAGQSIQAQGIIHGGGKYALRSVTDVESMRAIAAMPQRWRDHVAGRDPDLSAATVLSPTCALWLPRQARLRAWLDRWGVMPLLRHGQVLQSPPTPVARAQWPPALASSATAVYEMAEPVFATASVLEALRTPVTDRILLTDPGVSAVSGADGWSALRARPAGGEAVELTARGFVLAAGAGNEPFLDGEAKVAMQRRPLQMVMLKGPLPALFGHCVLGGRPRLTVTSSEEVDGQRCWQLGGEIAEQLAGQSDPALIRERVVHELRRCLPGLPLSRCVWASYAAVRAEAATRSARRPSGVDVHRVQANVLVAWPTKMALAPLLADEVAAELATLHPGPVDAAWRSNWPRPAVASYPWENVSWNPVH